MKISGAHVAKEQEREEEGQASPHPGLETLYTPGEERGVTELTSALSVAIIFTQMETFHSQTKVTTTQDQMSSD